MANTLKSEDQIFLHKFDLVKAKTIIWINRQYHDIIINVYYSQRDEMGAIPSNFNPLPRILAPSHHNLNTNVGLYGTLQI